MKKPKTAWIAGRLVKGSSMKAKLLVKKDLHNRPLLRSDYYTMSQPILWIQLIFGRTPYHVGSGWMQYSFKSIPFRYAVLLALVNLFCYIYYYQQIANAWYQLLGASINFSNVLFSFFIFTQPFSTVLMVYSWFFEVPAIVKCYNTTAILEKKISDMIPTCTRKPLTKHLVTFSIAFFFISTMVTGYFLIIGRYYNASPLFILISIIINFTVNYSHSVLWFYNFYFIRDFAMNLNKHMLLCLHRRENCAFKIKICRKIWISIWKQSQRFSQSNASTVSYTLLTNGMIFVIGCYGVTASLRNNDIVGILEISPYVSFSFTNIACIFEITYQATNRLGKAFLNTMIILDRDGVDREAMEEVDKFIDIINHTRSAEITLKDYMTVDRTLLISFMSYSVTYLIVLLQFQDTNTEVAKSASVLSKNNSNLTMG